jgi:two-component system chemotaxis response regulator CheB
MDNVHLNQQTTTVALVIGASTGGPEALHTIIRQLPSDLPCPVFIAQHMMPEFMEDFVASLNKEMSIKVELGGQNQVVENSVVYVAPGGCDMKVVFSADHKIRLITAPALTVLQPSVDVLMASAATVYGSGCVGVILTGMGRDGLEGMRAIKSVGGKTVIQNEATSTVYGMAKAVNDEHLADLAMALEDIPNLIVELGRNQP